MASVKKDRDEPTFEEMLLGKDENGVAPHIVIEGMEGKSVPFDRHVLGVRILRLLRHRQAALPPGNRNGNGNGNHAPPT